MTTGNVVASPPSSGSDSDSESDGSERELGRHDYWESTYERELVTLQETGDEGEVWFGGKVEEAVAAFCAELLLPQTPPASSSSSSSPPRCQQPRILDVGCGNGALLLALAARGFRDLTGSDYSEKALALARAVVQRRKGKEAESVKSGDNDSGPLSRASFHFVHDDATRSSLAARSFDAATDKGTLDAVGLSAGRAAARRAYLLGVARCLKEKTGVLVVTSVNSTLEELRAEVEALRVEHEEEEKEEADAGGGATTAAAATAGDDDGGGVGEPAEKNDSSSSSSPPLFEYLDHVKTYPVYSFGGRTGARVATVAFRKR